MKQKWELDFRFGSWKLDHSTVYSFFGGEATFLILITDYEGTWKKTNKLFIINTAIFRKKMSLDIFYFIMTSTSTLDGGLVWSITLTRAIKIRLWSWRDRHSDNNQSHCSPVLHECNWLSSALNKAIWLAGACVGVRPFQLLPEAMAVTRCWQTHNSLRQCMMSPIQSK